MSKFKTGDRVCLVNYPAYTGTVLSFKCGDIIEVLMDNIGVLGYRPDSIELIEESRESYNESGVEQEDYSYYKYSYKGIKLDPYRILDIYKITCPAQQHAIKKLLRAGNSVKELKQDITEVIDTLKRKLEMLEEEDSDNP